MLGGLGICGKPFCCSQFLDEFQPVSIKMAKTQNLSLNPTKISGTCGRLMCCLKYEQEAYEDLVKHAPKQESFVETPDGAGTVSSVNLLRQTVQVRLESAPETPKCYHNCELCVIRNGKGKRPEGYVEPPLEQLAQLRRKVEDAPEEKREFSGEGSLWPPRWRRFSAAERRARPHPRPLWSRRGARSAGNAVAAADPEESGVPLESRRAVLRRTAPARSGRSSGPRRFRAARGSQVRRDRGEREAEQPSPPPPA